MEKPAFNIKELEVYLLQKKAGIVNKEMEQKIQEDSFLQNIVIGLEKTMNKHQNVPQLLEKKKQKNWLALSPTLATPNKTITSNADNTILNVILDYFSLKNYNPHYLRIHLLLGFNCSCVLALIVMACWLNSSQEATMLANHLEGIVGYKP